MNEHQNPVAMSSIQIRNMKNKAAIDLQCKLNGKLIAALLFILYSNLIFQPIHWD